MRVLNALRRSEQIEGFQALMSKTGDHEETVSRIASRYNFFQQEPSASKPTEGYSLKSAGTRVVSAAGPAVVFLQEGRCHGACDPIDARHAVAFDGVARRQTA